MQNDQTTGLSIITRLFWMFFGNAVLFISTVFIVEHKGGMFHTADVFFWITIITLIFVRYLDIKFCGGLTATGNPASIAHWSKYAILLLIFSTSVWAIAHAVNYLVVNR
jgi:hypothetical protein